MARLHERRFRNDPLTVGSKHCRICLRVVELQPEYVETTDMYVYVRCPHCEHSFPVRRSDVDAILSAAAPSPGPVGIIGILR